jgi:hypothetical protein
MQRASVKYKRRSSFLVPQDRSGKREHRFLDRIHVRVCPGCFLNPDVSKVFAVVQTKDPTRTRPRKTSKGFMASSYLVRYLLISSALLVEFAGRGSSVPRIPEPEASDWSLCMYRTFSYSFRLSPWSERMSVRRSVMTWYCFRNSWQEAVCQNSARALGSCICLLPPRAQRFVA